MKFADFCQGAMLLSLLTALVTGRMYTLPFFNIQVTAERGKVYGDRLPSNAVFVIYHIAGFVFGASFTGFALQGLLVDHLWSEVAFVTFGGIFGLVVAALIVKRIDEHAYRQGDKAYIQMIVRKGENIKDYMAGRTNVLY